MHKIELEQVFKSYGTEKVLENLNLGIEAGGFTVLLGPSGCGKSTILRLIAGLEDLNSGTIRIDGKDIGSVHPGDREIAMVFQNYALYPTMTVHENIEFGLKNHGLPRALRDKRIREVSEMVGLGPYMKKKPQFLSGGQRQRVALARAMVKEPQIFLMDEPLSNLDATLRVQLRTELIELHRRLGATFIYVTHDQVEAMSMGTRIVLLEKGEVRQNATPAELYAQPANTFSARFIGTPPMNLVDAQALKLPVPEGVATIGFRPEKAGIQATTEGLPEGHLHLEGELVTHEMLGAETLYKVRFGNDWANVRLYENRDVPYGKVWVHVAPKDLFFFDAQGQRAAHLENRS